MLSVKILRDEVEFLNSCSILSGFLGFGRHLLETPSEEAKCCQNGEGRAEGGADRDEKQAQLTQETNLPSPKSIGH